MISTLVEFLRANIIPLGAFGVFSATFIEEVIAPIPSALVLLLSGFLFLSGPMGWSLILTLVIKIVIPATLGITIGSLAVYGIAYFLGQPFLEKWGKYLGVTWDSVERAKERFSKTQKDELTLFVTRTIPVIPSVAINAFCGMVRFPFISYITLTFLGTLIRASILGLIGWKVGDYYSYYASILNKTENIVWYLIIIAIIGFLAFRNYKRDDRG